MGEENIRNLIRRRTGLKKKDECEGGWPGGWGERPRLFMGEFKRKISKGQRVKGKRI